MTPKHPRCPICNERIPRNSLGKFNKTCSEKCRATFKADAKRQSKKVCPICGLTYLAYEDEVVCPEWDCGIARRRAKNWGIPIEMYNDEARARDRQQYHINRTLGLNQINVPECRISCGD